MIDFSKDVPDVHKESYLKYLTFIQDVITRMNHNAFQLKGWCITIVVALAALAVDKGSAFLFLVAAVSVLPFCFLDAYYLLMERQFRGLYNDVVNGCSEITIFSMLIARYTRKGAKTEQDKRKYNYWQVVFSSSVFGFYMPLFVICILTCCVLRLWS